MTTSLRPMRFVDRVDAGRRLADALLADAEELQDRPVVVLGLPRGGVPVAAVVAAALRAPLDFIGVRKIGVPWQPELAMGAIAEEGVEVLDARVLAATHVSADDVADLVEAERVVLAERVALLRAHRPRVPLEGVTAIVVDDGLATGSTARAACQVARRRGAGRVLLAVPVGAAGTIDGFADADRVVSVLTPREFSAVGEFYDDFSPTSDAEVVRLLEASPTGTADNAEERPGSA